LSAAAVVVARQQSEQRTQQHESEHLRPQLRLQHEPARRREQDDKLDGRRRARRSLGIGDEQQGRRRAGEFPQLEPDDPGGVIYGRHHDLGKPFVIAPSMTRRGV
jgi:hypothetical protein